MISILSSGGAGIFVEFAVVINITSDKSYGIATE
jgi:hypothetical protein